VAGTPATESAAGSVETFG